jgi:hypothetical protein
MTMPHMGIEATQAFGYLRQGRNSAPFSPFSPEVFYEFYTGDGSAGALRKSCPRNKIGAEISVEQVAPEPSRPDQSQ